MYFKRQESAEETVPFISIQVHPFGLESVENIFLCPERCEKHLYMCVSEEKPFIPSSWEEKETGVELDLEETERVVAKGRAVILD